MMTRMRESSSVIICTRNRPDDIVRAVASLLTDESPDLELIVVDQSDRDDTALALRSLQDDRLRYLRSRTQGKGGALNEGLRLVRSQFVVCTDDDCEASAGWSTDLVQPMFDRPQVALVFSRVEASEYDRQLGYIPDFLPSHDRLLTRPRDICDGWGLGAGMAFRRDVVVEMGGVDRAFGPGGRFPSADDFDLELRLLIKGWHVYENSSARITHHGFRTLHEGRAHTVRDWSALGASCAKALRGGHPVAALAPAASILWKRAFWPSVQAIARRQKPPLRRVSAFVSGFASGLRLPVDHHKLLYVSSMRVDNDVTIESNERRQSSHP